jgi:hypothetical protein
MGKWHLGHTDRKYRPRQGEFDYQDGSNEGRGQLPKPPTAARFGDGGGAWIPHRTPRYGPPVVLRDDAAGPGKEEGYGRLGVVLLCTPALFSSTVAGSG